MSARQSPGLEGLFGYSVVDGNEPQHKTNSRQPTGPPLLDDAQSDLLHNFFQNPDDVDPAFLSHNDFSTPSEGMLNPQGFNGWMFNNGSSTSHDMPPNDAQPVSSQYAAQSHPPQPRHAPQDFASVANHSGPMTPSDDVWAAAQMLHGQNGNGQGQQMHSTGHFGSSRAESLSYSQHQQGQPFDYTSAAAAQQSPTGFAFNQHAVPNGGFNAANVRQQPPDRGLRTNVVDAQHGAGLQRPKSRPTPPLKFGSDAHFRSDSFKAPNKFEPPDLAFRETINHNFRHAENNPLGMNPLSAGSDSHELSPTRKRRGAQARPGAQETQSRVSVKETSEQQEEDDDEEEEEEEQHQPSAKRRKSKAIKRESPADKGRQTGAGGKSTPQDKPSHHRSSTKALTHSPAPSSTPRARPTASVAANEPSSATATAGDDAEQRPVRENLSEEQKRTNHIQSEQKRRNLIKQGFDDLNRMVPELRAGGFSKSNVLVEVAKFMRLLGEGNAALRDKLAALDNG